MLLFSLKETIIMLVAAVVLDGWIGDPKRPVHPVIRIGQLISWLERKLIGSRTNVPVSTNTNEENSSYSDPPPPDGGVNKPNRTSGQPTGLTHQAAEKKETDPSQLRFKGALLACTTVGAAIIAMWGIVGIGTLIHPWIGYVFNTWFIASTLAVKGLRDAAFLVYTPLKEGRLDEARRYIGYIVGRDTEKLEEKEISRAAVETVAENTVDAFVSPLFFAFLGGAPLAMGYRAVNTLDSMVGYKNERYLHFGWFSARLDDVLNWLPARITGFLMVLSALTLRGLSVKRTIRSIQRFAGLHPSPNSGIPEAAAAGAMGIELGGINYYEGQASERARMGWPLVEINRNHIRKSVLLLYRVRMWIVGGLAGLWIMLILLGNG